MKQENITYEVVEKCKDGVNEPKKKKTNRNRIAIDFNESDEKLIKKYRKELLSLAGLS